MLWDLLLAGDVDRIVQQFDSIDDPEVGRFSGAANVSRFAAHKGEWLRRHETGHVLIDHLRDGDRAVFELRVSLAGLPEPLPVAVVADGRNARIYHGMLPLGGAHLIRPPLIASRLDLQLPAPVAAYVSALSAADPDRMAALYEPDGRLAGPWGDSSGARGRRELRAFHAAAFADGRGGGVQLEPCALIADRAGGGYALEYVCSAWGGTAIPPQAGLAVFRPGPGGLIAACRIYDDVAPPARLSRAGAR